MPDPIRQAIPTPEQLQSMAAGFGRIGIAAQLAVARMVETLSAADPTYFGRKRRARRARGRRIEARQPYSSAALAWRIAREAVKPCHLSPMPDPTPAPRPASQLSAEANYRARQRGELPRVAWLICEACSARHKGARHLLLCPSCWERLTPDGRQYRTDRVKRHTKRKRAERGVDVEP